MNESQQEVIEQITVIIPFLDDEVPALYLAVGRLYVPVFAVSQALGIRMFCGMRTVCYSTRETQTS